MNVIVDYGVGNLFSLKSSLNYIGVEAVVSGDAGRIRAADRVLLPGVGAFGDAMKKLSANGLDRVVVEQAKKGKPLMGICLGMQLLFNRSYEFGETDGLGLIEGTVKPIKPYIPESYKVPHIGWNALHFTDKGRASKIFSYIAEGDYVYFVHSFAAVDCRESVIAETEYGPLLTAAVQEGNVYGMQFHPEKSGETGLNILRAFCEL